MNSFTRRTFLAAALAGAMFGWSVPAEARKRRNYYGNGYLGGY